MPFRCARCGHVSCDPGEIRESYCASCGDWSPNASLAPEPAPPADLEYQCRGCGAEVFVVPGLHKGQVYCTCGEQRPCLPAGPRQAEVSVRHAELDAAMTALSDWSVTCTGQFTEDQVALLAGLGQARPDQLAEILAAGRRLEADVAALREGASWYQRARLLAAAALRSIIRPRLRSVPEGSSAEADGEHEDWVNPYSWRPGDPQL